MLKFNISQPLATKNRLVNLFKTGAMGCVLLLNFSIYANAATNNYGDDNIQLNQYYDPSYDPIGMSVWAFILDPSVTVGEKYTSNVYAVENNTVSDRITVARAELLLKSDFTRHKLNIKPFAEAGRYSKYSSENYDDHGLNIDARIDVTDSDNIPLTFNYAQLHEDRENPDVLGNIEPLVFTSTDASAGLVHTQQTLIYKIITSFKRMVYDDAEGSSGTIDESFRDKDIMSVHTSIGIQPDAILAPYIFGNFQKLKYPTPDASGINRDSNDYEAGIGTIFNYSEVTRMSFNVGQKNRSFEDSSIDDIKTMTFGSNISWEPLEYLSFLFEADKTIQEAIFTGTSASINTSYRFSANYQIRDNIYLQPSYTLLNREYQGPSGGELETESSGLNMIYKMNPNIWMNASYQHTNQDKKEDAPGLRAFQRDLYGVSLKLQF